MRRRIVALVAFCTDAAATALAWSRLPEQAPVHWDLQGQPDRYGSRLELVLLGPGLILGTWLLLELVRIVDPRRPDRAPAGGGAAQPAPEGGRDVVESMLVALMAALHVVLLAIATGWVRQPLRLLALFVAALLVGLGNFIGRLRPNWFIGIRTPWTLSSDEVWRRTHRLAARMMVAAGLALVPTAFALPPQAAFIVSFAALLAGVLVPAAWSYALWRERKGASNGRAA